ncbi:corticotropin-releasing diuretic hormone 44 [Musca autumnalis]|uniref:corticotropin-releasing diuretic hormone 44 n=1 Tax=Musca autumnalis TaxID=221902 RepID=UPI003CF41201
MKPTTWLCPVLTLLCATQLVYTAQRGNYGSYHPAMDAMDSNAIQNDYFLSKRNKPSLSIVNPLDVLRQRLLLEIARRQMKENTRQVELNRAILKNVGKRMTNKHPHPFLEQQWMDAMNGGGAQQSQRHQLNDDVDGDMQRESMPMQPYDDLELIPSTLIFDYLQQQQRRPWLANDRRTSMSFDNYDDDNVNGANVAARSGGDMEDLDVVSSDGIKLAFQPMAANGPSDERHETTMKKPINLSGHEGEPKENLMSSLKHHKNNDFKLNDLATLALNEGSNARNDNSDDNNNSKNSVTSNKNGINDDNQVDRYLYHLHKNHLTRK